MNIRLATPQDVFAMATVNVETRRSMYVGIFPAELLARASPERIAERWMKNLFTEPNPPGSFGLVAEEKGEVIGFVMAGLARDKDLGASGEMYTLYVLPRCHRQGIGHRLLQEAARYLQQQGHSAFFLWVLSANLPSRAFYEALGGEIIGQRFEDVKGYALDETAYIWRDIHKFLSKPG
jgi:ribosomal protein S18 acetylase RimI-like enzyme